MTFSTNTRSLKASVCCITLAGVLTLHTPLHAHVRIEPYEINPGGYATLVFWLYHGCDSSPTVAFTLKIPDGIAVVTPQVKSGWEISTVTAEYAEPVSVYGATVTNGFIEITWTGGPIPAKYMDTFVLTAFIPSRQDNDVLCFLAIQKCAGAGASAEFAPEVHLASSEKHPPVADTQDALPGRQRLPLIVAFLGLLVGAIALSFAMAQRRHVRLLNVEQR